jgi:hypothetical protein
MATKVRETAWSVAAEKIRMRIKENMPAEMKAQIELEAQEQALSDVYGAGWKERVNLDGSISENGIGSDYWLANCKEGEYERHVAAIFRFEGPASADAMRQKIARLRGNKK